VIGASGRSVEAGRQMSASRRRRQKEAEPMNRAAGTGLMALAVVMIVVGAILEFAVSVTTSGFNINTIGMILLIVGIVLFVVSLVVLVTGSSRRSTLQEDVRSVPGGEQRIVEQRDNLP
jgi:uncharacterized membrane protein YgdD (TMEM256/DUF423 family)